MVIVLFLAFRRVLCLLLGSTACLGVVKMSVVLLLHFYKPQVCIFIMIAAVKTFKKYCVSLR